LRKLLVLIALSVLMVIPAIGAKAEIKQERKKDAFDMMSAESKDKLVKLFVEDYGFTSSKEYKNYPETLNNFFSEPIYQKLTGNFMRGYSYDEGFKFDGKEIAIGTLKAVSEGRPYLKRFIEIFDKVFTSNGVKFVDKSKANYEIGMCIVSVMPKLTEISFPGVFLEVLMKNNKTGKSLFYRFGQGSKKGLNKAMADSATMVLATLMTNEPVATSSNVK
jgi:urate oxidase